MDVEPEHTSRLGNLKGLRLGELAAVGVGGAESLDLELLAGLGDEVGELVLALLGLDLGVDLVLLLGEAGRVDQDELELLGVGLDALPLDDVGLGKIPLGAICGLGELESRDGGGSREKSESSEGLHFDGCWKIR